MNSVNSTNPFDDGFESDIANGNSTLASKRYRKKRRAPLPPPRVSIKCELIIKKTCTLMS